MTSKRIHVLGIFLIMLSFVLTACVIDFKKQFFETKEATGITSQPSLESTHNLKDMDGFKKNDEFSFPVDLNSWGKVNFTSG